MQSEWLQGETRTGAIPAAPACPLPDGFHALPWTAIDLPPLVPAWDHLARTAASPNPFFESWYLLPSLADFDPPGEVELAMLVEEGQLVALVPSWRNPRYQARRLAHIEPWLHANMFIGVPLVANGAERRFWQAYLARVDGTARAAWFLHLPLMPLADPVTVALQQVCAEQDRQLCEVLRRRRAELRTGPSPEQHLVAAMGNKKRKELRRQRKRLDEEGAVTIEHSRKDSGLERWIDQFLALESDSWKGRCGSAQASDERNERVFRAALSGAAVRGRLERISLVCDGRPVAMLASFLTAPGAFSYKTAYDEDFARFSPGLLLQIENLALLEDPAIVWCDSCAAQGHAMIERIWRDRRELVWLSVAVGHGLRRRAGELLVRLEAGRMERKA